MDGGGALVMIWLLAVSSAQEPCGPDKLCTCHDSQMDCTGKHFQSICGICNSSFGQNVTHLYASNNMIHSLEDAACVTGCKNLNILDLNHNQITKIGADVFEMTHQLSYLDVSFNKLSVYTHEGGKVFQHLRKLRTLKINDNFLDKSGTDMYSYPDLSNLKSLENLHMDGLRGLPFDSSFSKLTHLNSLFISSQSGQCDLGELQNDSFQHLGQIETLGLSDCNISNIDVLTFALPNLRWLDLSHNRRLGFETLHNVSYSLQFTNIELLNYSYVYNTFGPSTSLKKHNMCYLWNTTLKHIVLDSNRMGMMDSNVPILFPPTLQYISLNYNEFRFESYIIQVGCFANVTVYNESFMGFSGDLRLYFTEPRYPPNEDVFLNANGCPFMQETFMKYISEIRKDCRYIEDAVNPIVHEQLSTKCRNNTVWIVLTFVGVTLCLSVIAGGLVYRNRWTIRYFLYRFKQRFNGYFRLPDEAPIENFKYTAFVSYTSENFLFVKDEFLPNVEQNGISLCIHKRDFVQGNNIAENIVDAIQSSKKTVVLLSKAFLKSTWCMYELNMARMESILSRDESCLVIVMLEHVPAQDMPVELLNVLRTEPYIEYTCEPEGQLLFWGQLRQAITQPTKDDVRTLYRRCNFKYNAFVAFNANENLLFVKDELIPNVEQNGISLCVHQRDFMPGNNIADSIVDAIQSSRKTVVLLSKAFLKSKWCIYELNMARMESILSRDESCLVIVMLEHVPAQDMPVELLNVLRTETYIEYTCEPEGQLLFWEQLRQAITQPTKDVVRTLYRRCTPTVDYRWI